MSTAWYRPNNLPRKIRSWTSLVGRRQNVESEAVRSIEVWETTCVVTNMNTRGKTGSSGSESDDTEDKGSQDPFSVLINPGNPSLSGVSKFSYFPVGGPEPPPSFTIGKDSHPIMGYVTQWGGMEVGNGMSFASNTVDGIVHQYGGKELKRECEAVLSSTWIGESRTIEEGNAISTPVVGPKLKAASGYDILVHTVPPFVDQDYRSEDKVKTESDDNDDDRQGIGEHNDFLLAECYRNSLKTAALVSPSNSGVLKVASPLLGAGCRGFTTERAIQVAAKATAEWAMEATTTDYGKLEETTKSTSNDDDSKTNYAKDVSHSYSLLKSWFGGGGGGSRRLKSFGADDTTSCRSITLAFGIPDGEIRKQLIEAIDQEMKRHTP